MRSITLGFIVTPPSVGVTLQEHIVHKIVRNYAALLLVIPFVFACAGGEDEMVDEGMAMEEMAASEEVDMGSQDSPCWVNGEAPADRPSPLESTTFEYDGGMGTICYGAPSVRGRVIFGELVPFGEPWRLGANEATTVHLTGPAQIGGVALEAGSYSLYATPSMDGEWEFNFNSMTERWGIPINDEVMASNVGSFMAAPEASEEMTETMTFSFEPWDNERAMGDIVLSWADTRVKFHVHPAG